MVCAGRFLNPVLLNTPLMVVEFVPIFFMKTHSPEARVEGVKSTTVPEIDGFNKIVLNRDAPEMLSDPLALIATMFTGAPFGPVAPVAPIDPAGPVGPVAPWSLPVGPVGPEDPIEEGPVGPVGPVDPSAPLGP